MSEPTIEITRKQLQDAVSTASGPLSRMATDRLWKKLGGKESTEELLDEARLAYSDNYMTRAAEQFIRLDTVLLNGGKLPECWLPAAEALMGSGRLAIDHFNNAEALDVAQHVTQFLADRGLRVRFKDEYELNFQQIFGWVRDALKDYQR